jgi:hypothetical protein
MPATPLQRILAQHHATPQTEREEGSYFEEQLLHRFRPEAHP